MEIVMPIKNLLVYEDFEIRGIRFISNKNSTRYLRNLGSMSLNISNNCLLNYLIDTYPCLIHEFSGKVLAICEVDTEKMENVFSAYGKIIEFGENYAELVDEALDIIRYQFCNVTRLEDLPMYPGIFSEGTSGFLLVYEDETYTPLTYKIHLIGIVEQPGLEIDNVKTISDEPLFSFFNDEKSSSFSSILVRKIMRRLSKSMYIYDPNVRFVYLMTTVEIVSSMDEYRQSKCVKKLIGKLISPIQKDYENVTKRMEKYFHDYRTEIVHNGKDIFGPNRKLLFEPNLLDLQTILARVIEVLVTNDFQNEKDYLSFIEEKQKQLFPNS